MKKSIILLAFCFFATVLSTKAQDFNNSTEYTTSVGVRFLNGAGVTFKHFINDKAALEGIAFWGAGGLRVTGLYEFHYDINGADGLKWYVGPGAHVGFYQSTTVKGSAVSNTSFIGVDGVLGLDYKINGVPLNVSLDWQPTFEFGQGRGFAGSLGGFGLRYTF